MLKRPSSRRRTAPALVQINLVPMLDALVTLIGFLLFSMSFLALVHIETPKPEVSSQETQEQLKEKPLQLTVSLGVDQLEIWSPFERIQAKKIPNHPDGTPDIQAMNAALIDVKRQFLKETKVVFVPHAGTSYDVLVSVMDAARGLEVSDPPLFVKNEATGNDEPVKVLFPEVIFGNLLGDS